MKRLSPNGDGPWYRMADLVRLFDVTDRSIWKWISQGKIPQPVRRGRKWSRWPKDKIDALVREWGAEPNHVTVA